MKIIIQYWSILLIICYVSVSQQASGDVVTGDVLIPVGNLAEDAELSRSKNLVLVLEFSSEYCEYCDLLEEEFLRPMARNRGYSEKIIIRTAQLFDGRRIVGFNGEPTSIDALAKLYNVVATPTLLFLGADGKQLSEPLVGIWSIDFFGSFIDERIDEAISKLP